MKTQIEIIKNKYRNIDYTITYIHNSEGHFSWTTNYLVSTFSNEKVISTNSNTSVDFATTKEEFFILNSRQNSQLLREERHARASIDLYVDREQATTLPCNKKHFDKVFGMYASYKGEMNKASYDVFYSYSDTEIKVHFNTTKTFNPELIKSLLKRLGIDPKFLLTYAEAYPNSYRYSSCKRPSHVLRMEGYKFSEIDNDDELREKRRELNRFATQKFTKTSRHAKSKTFTPAVWSADYNNRNTARMLVAEIADLQGKLQKFIKQANIEGDYKYEVKLVKVK